MARPLKRQKTESFEITVPRSVHDALVHLATVGPHGYTENTVAATLIGNEIARMQRAGEYGLSMPTMAPPTRDGEADG